MSQGDIFAIRPTPDATLIRAAAPITGSGTIDLELEVNDISPHGTGYQIGFLSAGDDTGITFTITGIKVGDLSGKYVTEDVTGVNASTATSSNFYTYVSSITVDGASAGNVSIGSSGKLAFGRTRIKSLYYVGATSAGAVTINVNSETGPLLLRIDTPAGSTAFADSVTIPDQGILTQRSNTDDFAILTLTNITNATVFCG